MRTRDMLGILKHEAGRAFDLSRELCSSAISDGFDPGKICFFPGTKAPFVLDDLNLANMLAVSA